MTKTFRDNCDINIVQQTSCEPLFPDVHMQLKLYFFVPFVRPCMHHNYGVTSGSHACRDCVWPTVLDVELYTTCPGERMLVANSHQVQCNIPTFEALIQKLRTCFSKDAENLTTFGSSWMQSDCLYTSLFFEHYNRILLCNWVLEHCSVCLIDGASCHTHWHFTWTPTSLGIGALICSSVVTSVTC